MEHGVLFPYSLIQGSLPPLLKELILFSVSLKNASPYCMEFHASNAIKKMDALSYQQLVEIVSGSSNSVLPKNYHVAIDIITNHSQAHCLLPKLELQKLEGAGFSNEEIIEMLGVCSLALAFNVLTMSGNIPIDEDHKINSFYMPG